MMAPEANFLLKSAQDRLNYNNNKINQKKNLKNNKIKNKLFLGFDRHDTIPGVSMQFFVFL